jgi:hypothetical protein
MTHVVAFLSQLCAGDENSSVRRMLSVCSEFERIAKIVLDKADKDNHSRRKRKQQESRDGEKNTPSRHATTPSVSSQHAPRTPQPSQPGNIPNVFTPPDYNKYFQEDVSCKLYVVNSFSC